MIGALGAVRSLRHAGDESLHLPWIKTLRWMPVPGDTLGAVILVIWVFRHRSERRQAPEPRPGDFPLPESAARPTV